MKEISSLLKGRWLVANRVSPFSPSYLNCLFRDNNNESSSRSIETTTKQLQMEIHPRWYFILDEEGRKHGFARVSRETVDIHGYTGGIVEGGGKSMENYLPNFSRASNGRMATFHLSFLISPPNVRSFEREILRWIEWEKGRGRERRRRRRRRRIKKKGRKWIKSGWVGCCHKKSVNLFDFVDNSGGRGRDEK